MIGIVKVALTRPLTFIVMAILIAIVGVLSAARTPVDIFPEIRVPVIAAAWNYAGLSPDDMSGRIITPYERILTTTVNDIDHIESQSMPGIGIVKIYFQPGVDIRTATAQVTVGVAVGAAPAAARHHAAADPELQRLDRADPAARAVGQGPVRRAHCSIWRRTASAPASSRCRAPPSPIPRAGGRGRSRSISIPQALQSKGLCRRRT